MVYRAMAQGGEAGPQVDQAVVPPVRGQPGAAGAVRTGLQPGQLLEAVGLTRSCESLVAAERAGQADQDRRPPGAPRAPADLPACPSGGAASPLPGRAGPHRPVMPDAWLAAEDYAEMAGWGSQGEMRSAQGRLVLPVVLRGHESWWHKLGKAEIVPEDRRDDG